jgi:hypothetical protein
VLVLAFPVLLAMKALDWLFGALMVAGLYADERVSAWRARRRTKRGEVAP